MKEPVLHVACTEDTIYCRVRGLGNMNNSYFLREFSETAYYNRGCSRLVLDLAECKGMDSTFMGTLVGLRNLNIQVVLVNASEDHLRLLRGLGLHQLLHIASTPFPEPTIQLSPLDQRSLSRREFLETIYQAHRNLIEAEPENAKQFGTFVETLFRELNGQ